MRGKQPTLQRRCRAEVLELPPVEGPRRGLRKRRQGFIHVYTTLSRGWGGEENRDTTPYLRSCKMTLQSLSQPREMTRHGSCSAGTETLPGGHTCPTAIPAP